MYNTMNGRLDPAVGTGKQNFEAIAVYESVMSKNGEATIKDQTQIINEEDLRERLDAKDFEKSVSQFSQK